MSEANPNATELEALIQGEDDPFEDGKAELVPIETSDPEDKGDAVGNLNIDSDYVRKKLYHLTQKAEVVLDEAFDAARVDQAARSFEVCSTLMRSYVDALSKIKECGQENYKTSGQIERDKAAKEVETGGGQPDENGETKVRTTITTLMDEMETVEKDHGPGVTKPVEGAFDDAEKE